MSASNRCGFRLDMGLADDLSIEKCARPIWDDHDHCVWHAEVEGKTTEDLESNRPEPDEHIDGAYLVGASLIGLEWFADTSLVGADLTGATLNDADFSESNLMLATLTDVTAIHADFGGANLEGAVFTNADLRRANLAGVCSHGAVFTDVHIGSETSFGDTSVYERGVEPTIGETHPLEAAAWSYREFQQIYGDNALPQLARRSYNQEKDARRRLAWDTGDRVRAVKWELSRWVMRYGSSAYRVLGVSLLVILVSAILYPLTDGIREVQGDRTITYALENPESAPAWWIGEVLFKSFYFSVITFATLGYGDIQPIGRWARLLAGVETILGSLLSALLVFVLTRIVTR